MHSRDARSMQCRGDQREAIFRDDVDLQSFLTGEVSERTGFVVQSYALMHNHYHLLLATQARNLRPGG